MVPQLLFWRVSTKRADPARLEERLREKGLKRGDPVFLRIFKADLEVELWMKRSDRFELFAAYPICAWSGQLGPKLIEGDGQAPEGFYSIGKDQLNANSRYHRAFNLGYPNSLRPRVQADGGEPYGAWRMRVDRLLRHDRCGDR